MTYLRLKGSGKPETFRRAAERSCGYAIDVCGDKPLTTYTRKDANAFRDALVARGMAGSSITKLFGMGALRNQLLRTAVQKSATVAAG
ncbi:hypothetical protein JSE7799_00457 [Jannaschia seosinensis]|uniref:Uncharacterized protein n=1 Tax=Jannaschia seosinensis TaxID=313367 RepID=A0A0M7B7F9_9RHOB|nr:hypothetical protein JSE7799_00457 [Jannaschia seosinensis]